MATNRPWTLGAQFRHWRLQAGMHTEEVAQKLHVAQQTVSGWETNASTPRRRIASLIDDVYGLTPGMALAVIEGQTPPPGLVDPLAVDIDANGRLIWNARYPVGKGRSAAFSGISTEGLAEDDITWLGQQADFLRSRQNR